MDILTAYQQDRAAEGLPPVPTAWIVCPSCKGRGTTSAHLGAITADEMHDLGDDVRDDYLAGAYDRPCPECDGRTTVRDADRDAMTADQIRDLDRYLDADAHIRAMEAAERRAGC